MGVVCSRTCVPFGTSSSRFARESSEVAPGPGSYHNAIAAVRQGESNSKRGFGALVSGTTRWGPTGVNYTGPGPGKLSSRLLRYTVSCSIYAMLLQLHCAGVDGRLWVQCTSIVYMVCMSASKLRVTTLSYHGLSLAVRLIKAIVSAGFVGW